MDIWTTSFNHIHDVSSVLFLFQMTDKEDLFIDRKDVFNTSYKKGTEVFSLPNFMFFLASFHAPS